MPIDTPKKHLTIGQRIRVIEGYIKVRFALQDEATYIIPPITLPNLAAEATSTLGFEVNVNQLTGCLKAMEEMGFTLLRPKAKPKSRPKLAVLEDRVRELEDQVEDLRSTVNQLMLGMMLNIGHQTA